MNEIPRSQASEPFGGPELDRLAALFNELKATDPPPPALAVDAPLQQSAADDRGIALRRCDFADTI